MLLVRGNTMFTKSLTVVLSLLILTSASTTYADDIPNNQFLYDEELETKEIPNDHVVNSGIIRGGRPEKGDLAELKKLGVKTIINIDNDEGAIAREKAEAKKLGLRYISSPLSAFRTPDDKQVDQIIAHLQDPEKMPIFIHCEHGRDRTGMIIGLYRSRVNKWSSKKAYQEMKDLGFRTILWKLDDYFKKKTNYSKIRNVQELVL